MAAANEYACKSIFYLCFLTVIYTHICSILKSVNRWYSLYCFWWKTHDNDGGDSFSGDVDSHRFEIQFNITGTTDLCWTWICNCSPKFTSRSFIYSQSESDVSRHKSVNLKMCIWAHHRKLKLMSLTTCKLLQFCHVCVLYLFRFVHNVENHKWTDAVWMRCLLSHQKTLASITFDTKGECWPRGNMYIRESDIYLNLCTRSCEMLNGLALAVKAMFVFYCWDFEYQVDKAPNLSFYCKQINYVFQIMSPTNTLW